MTEKWIKDTGLVLTLVFLFFGWDGDKIFLLLSGITLVTLLFIPRALYPIAYIWLKLTELLSFVVPKIFFSLIFFAIVMPVGLVRRYIGKDALLVNKTYSTAFFDRNHLFVKKDLETPF